MADHQEYTDSFVAGLQWMWGEGFLSPGGQDEMNEILQGIQLRGKTVLDIGCGLGGAEQVLAREHDVARVVGIDVEAALLERADKAIRDNLPALQARIDFKLVTPGHLPFGDDEFDVVFSKDSMIHITDKRLCYQEIRRVLKPGGKLAFGDWFGDTRPPTPEMERWLEVVGLSFSLETIQHAVQLLEDLNFTNIFARDRNTWYQDYMEQELDTISGNNQIRLANVIGREAAEQRLKSSLLKQAVVEQGQLRPGHVQATCQK